MMVSREKGTKIHADIYSTIHFVQSNSHFEFLYSTLQSRKPCVHPLHLFLKESWYPPVKIAYLKKWKKYDSLTSKDCFVHVVCCQNGCDSVPCATHISYPGPLQINTFFPHTQTKAYQHTHTDYRDAWTDTLTKISLHSTSYLGRENNGKWHVKVEQHVKSQYSSLLFTWTNPCPSSQERLW